MSTLLINNVLLNGKRQNVLIDGTRFKTISDNSITVNADEVIDGSNFAMVPPFYNGHCHAAMVLLRGFADDMPLQAWLNDSIWPMEAKMTAEDIYAGSRLAILEMIKSGTVFFEDMYWEEHMTAKAVEEMGIRAAIGVSLMDRQSDALKDELFEKIRSYKASDRVSYTVAPHAIYTVGTDLLKRCKASAEENNIYLNIHLAETMVEDVDCRKAHNGMSPVEYLDSLGLLSPKTILAHVVHVDQHDQDILARSGAVCVHNPASNMKLSSGVFKMKELQKNGCCVTIGTDGASSNNNLDMLEEMKLAALLAKCYADPEAGSATDVFNMATAGGAKAFGIDAGVIEEGRLADALLVDLNNEKLVPNYNLISNLVYSADSSCIDTVICNGKVVMKNRVVPGEKEIIEQARETCKSLIARK
ncbi:MAG: amidohydrolase [Paludibacteraceae bacterium]|nr:amidohydrolase [Paludibacteraceae bacterium]